MYGIWSNLLLIVNSHVNMAFLMQFNGMFLFKWQLTPRCQSFLQRTVGCSEIILWLILEYQCKYSNTVVLPYKVKHSFCIIRLHTNYFLLPWKIPEEIADDHCSSITKHSIYHLKLMSIQPFTMGVDSPEIGC